MEKKSSSSKLVGLFSGGHTSPSGKKGSSSSGEENEQLLHSEGKKLKRTNKSLTRSKTISSESDYTALKEASSSLSLSSGDKLKRSDSVGKKVGASLTSSSSVSKKQMLQIEVNLLTQLSEQNNRLVKQQRLIAVLEDRANQQETRLAMLETVISNIQKEHDQQLQQQQNDGCLGNWLTSMFT